MSTRVVIRIEGQEETIRNVSSFDVQKTDQLRKIVREFGRKIGSAARKEVPVSPPTRKKTHGSPGDLKKSIKAKYYYQNLGAMVGPMKPKGAHRGIIEYGTKERTTKNGHKTGKISPHPFMEPARKQYENTYNQKIKEVFDEDVIV